MGVGGDRLLNDGIEEIGSSYSSPLHCSCLENPREGGAWWAAFYGVARSRTRLKQLSSSSSSMKKKLTPYQIQLRLVQRRAVAAIHMCLFTF